MKLGVIVLYCSVLERACEFYGGVLGLPLQPEQHGAGPKHFSTRVGEHTILELYPCGDGPATRTRLEMDVRELRHIPEIAEQDGYPVTRSPGRAVINGPDGGESRAHRGGAGGAGAGTGRACLNGRRR